MHLLRFVTIVFALGAALGWSEPPKPNLTGRWILDASKSDFGGQPPPDAIVHVIDHKEPTIRIVSTTTWGGQRSEGTDDRTLTTDGKETLNKTRMMGREVNVRSTTRWDGTTLTTSWKFDVQGPAMEFVDSWSLSEDGKLLTLVRVAKTPAGDAISKTLYNRE